MASWSFLTNHARALVFIAEHPDDRLLDLATAIGVTERTAYGIVADLTAEGYIVKERAGRRNRYHIQDHLPLRDSVSKERSIGEVLSLLSDYAPAHRPHPDVDLLQELAGSITADGSVSVTEAVTDAVTVTVTRTGTGPAAEAPLEAQTSAQISDAPSSETGTSEAGTSEAGTSEAGTSEAGTSDAPSGDTGTSEARGSEARGSEGLMEAEG